MYIASEGRMNKISETIKNMNLIISLLIHYYFLFTDLKGAKEIQLENFISSSSVDCNHPLHAARQM